jgi:hypothetical protein
MPRFLSIAISLVFHPLLFPSYGTLLIVLSNPHLFAQYNERQQGGWLIGVFALTFLFPVIWLAMMKQLGMISSFSLESKKERIIPYIAIATFYLWTYRMFKPSSSNFIFSNQLISTMMLGATITVFIGFFVNIFRKVSIHAMGAGNFLGLLMVSINMSPYDLRIALIGAIILAGIIGTARLSLGAHTPREVFWGYFIGFVGPFISFSLLPMITNKF